MRLTIYTDASQYLARTQTYLEKQESTYSLMLGVCFQLAKHPERFEKPPCLATVESSGSLLLAAIMTPPYNLLLASEQADVMPALELLTESIYANAWRIPGVLARNSLARAFAELWAGKTGTHYKLEMAQRIYECREVIPPIPVSGMQRYAYQKDIYLVARWIYEFWEETFPQQQFSSQDALNLAKSRIDDGDIFLWEDKQPVSMAAKARPTRNGISISFVYTPAEFRNHGYATACVAELTQKLLASGCKFCTLFADLANPSSNRIYQKIGYRPIANMESYIFDDM